MVDDYNCEADRSLKNESFQTPAPLHPNTPIRGGRHRGPEQDTHLRDARGPATDSADEIEIDTEIEAQQPDQRLRGHHRRAAQQTREAQGAPQPRLLHLRLGNAHLMNQHKDDALHKRNKQMERNKQMARDKAILQRIKDAKVTAQYKTNIPSSPSPSLHTHHQPHPHTRRSWASARRLAATSVTCTYVRCDLSHLTSATTAV